MPRVASTHLFPDLGWTEISATVDKALTSGSGLVGVARIDVDPAPGSFDDRSMVDAVVARMTHEVESGDLTAHVDREFVIVRHPLVASAAMEGLGLRLVARSRRPLVVSGRIHQAPVSVGVATSRVGDTAPSLIRYAGYALDDAVVLGGNQMIAFPDEDRKLLRDR